MSAFTIVVLISGNGSTLQALIDAVAAKTLSVNIAAVISNRSDAFGLQRAKLAHIPTHVISHNDFTDRKQFDEALSEVIDQYQPQLIVLAGYMRILTPDFVSRYLGKIINIHPSLLPHYKGTRTHARVLENKEAFHGTSIHFVTEELDGGPVIAQSTFPITAGMTEAELEQRVHEIEHELYPQVIEWIAQGKVRWNDGVVELDPNI